MRYKHYIQICLQVQAGVQVHPNGYTAFRSLIPQATICTAAAAAPNLVASDLDPATK